MNRRPSRSLELGDLSHDNVTFSVILAIHSFYGAQTYGLEEVVVVCTVVVVVSVVCSYVEVEVEE